VTDFIYDEVLQNSKGICSANKRVAVRQGDAFFLVDTKGERVSEQDYENMKAFEEESMCAVCIDGKWGYIDKDGNLKLACSYEDAKSFTNGYAAVKKNGSWGYIDENNYMTIRPSFEDAGLMTENGVAPVCHENAWTLLQLKIME
jgi:hypothetical protein